jgi:AcrR family transcriptional regulator
MAVAIQISPNDSLFIKDPQTSNTGRNILNHAIPLMQEIGFEKFTFRKLAERMGASEITVYRYFENKHKLLLYLLSWYWEWVKYSISFNTRNLVDPEEKLKLAIRTVIDSSKRNTLVDYIDEEKLYKDLLLKNLKKHITQNRLTKKIK